MLAADQAPPMASLTTRVLRDGSVVAMTALVIVVLALLPLLVPWVMHPVLDAADAPAWLGMDRAIAHALSDRTVEELLFGPGTWQVVGPDGGPMFGASEIEHLRDVRELLWLTLLAGALSLVLLLAILERSADRDQVVAAIGLGGALVAIAVTVTGVIGVVAFDPLFEAFHRVFFPQGDWAFDPRSQRLVQLYPFAFWQIMAVLLGVLMVALGVTAWLVARVTLRRHARVTW